MLNSCTRLWLTESEQATPVDSIRDVVRSSVKVPEFDKHLKKAGGHIGQNVVEITLKTKTIVRKPLMIKIIKLRLRTKKKLISTNFSAKLSPLVGNHDEIFPSVKQEKMNSSFWSS